MVWIRALLFTALIPGVVGFIAPRWLCACGPREAGFWSLGWIPVAAGAIVYAICLWAFLRAGGTPAIFFARGLRAVVGEEPKALVRTGLYRYSRNPMYTGVLMAIFGQAVLFGSSALAIYGLCVFFFFHIVIVYGEEPHLRRKHGAAFEIYCRRTPRWLTAAHRWE